MPEIKADKVDMQRLMKESLKETGVMSARDIERINFVILPFTGKWKELFGLPSRNFTMMIFAKPKRGKSTLAIDFANYLATDHGQTLYCAVEEGIHLTLQNKIERMNANSDRLFFVDHVPKNFNNYDYIFIDSASRAKMDHKNIIRLKQQNPGKAFIFIYQSTKDGNFRGGQEIEHEVDMVVTIDDKGVAHCTGRFAQGTTLDVGKEYGLIKEEDTKEEF